MSEAPLRGLHVLIPRAAGQSEKTARAVQALGGVPLELATIRIGPPPDPEALRRAAREVRSYDVLALTSENAVEHFFDALSAEGLDARALEGLVIAAVGTATARALAARGASAQVVPREQRGEGLAADLLAYAPLAGKLACGSLRVLLPRAKVAREVLPETLRAGGATVEVVAAYETLPAGDDPLSNPGRAWLLGELGAGRVDVVLLTSGSTAEGFADLAAGADLSRVSLASIGPITTEAAKRRGLRVSLEADEATIEGLLRAVAAHFG